MSKLETEIKKINNKNPEKSINSVDEGNLIKKIQKIVKDSLNNFVVDKDLLDSKDKQINLLMEELEEKTKKSQKLKKNKAEKDEVYRLKQALSSKEQELNACKTLLSKKDNSTLSSSKRPHELPICGRHLLTQGSRVRSRRKLYKPDKANAET